MTELSFWEGLFNVIKPILLILALLGGIVLFFRWFERTNIYFPFRQIEQSPGDLRMDYEEFHYRTPDGETLHAWYLPCPRPARYTVLYFHGNAGNISHRLGKINVLMRANVNVFIFDYRGYGRSTGRPDEEGTYIDARASYQLLKETKGLDDGDIIFYGKSLGGAIASQLATEVEPAGVLLCSTFTSIGGMAREVFPLLPVHRFVSIRYNALENVPHIRSPLLIAHSPEDEIVPFSHGERLYEAATGRKMFCRTIGGHNEITDGQMNKVAECLRVLIRFIEREGGLE